MKKLVLLLLFSIPCFATEYNINYGLGVFLTKSNDVADVKMFSINRTDRFGSFQEKVEMGGWVDSAKYLENRRDGVYFSWSIGIRPEIKNFYVESYWGVLVHLLTDSYLSSNFNFVNDTGIGIKDSSGRMIGFYYKHISNAGLKLPNKGRDFMYLKVGISFP